METWATVVLVLGSNAIVVIGGLLGVRKQIKHWREQFGMEWEARREQDRRERRREVGSERLSKLSMELASMAAKGERVADLVQSMIFLSAREMASEKGMWLKEGQMIDGLKKAMDDWNSYIASGVFKQVLFMQDDIELVGRVSDIWQEYNRARFYMDIGYIKRWFDWLSEKGKKEEVEDMDKTIKRNMNIITENREKVAEVQGEIRRQLQDL